MTGSPDVSKGYSADLHWLPSFMTSYNMNKGGEASHTDSKANVWPGDASLILLGGRLTMGAGIKYYL